MIVVGGGVIGVEYTCMFSALGVRVTLIERRPRLLEFADQEIVEALSYHLRDSRVTMRLNEEVESRRRDARRHRRRQPRKQEEAAGRRAALRRRPPGQRRRAESRRRRRRSPTRAAASRSTRTSAPSVPNIFAVGDVIGFPSLASVSMEQGRIAAARAFGDDTILSNPSFYPYGIYTIPEISFIGKTEEQLTEEDVPYEVGVAYYREIARGQIRGDTTGRLKLIFHRDDPRHPRRPHHRRRRQRAAAHRPGRHGARRQARLLRRTVFNYPTLAECYKVAAFNGLNRVSKFE